MAIDLNMDMGELIKSMLNKNKNKSEDAEATSDTASSAGGGSASSKIKPFINMIVIFLIIGASAAGYYKFVYTEMTKKNFLIEEEIAELNKLKEEIVKYEDEIKRMSEKISASKEEYIKSLDNFGNSEDLGALYKTISNLAEEYGLNVLHIKEAPKKPAPAEPLNSKGKKGAFAQKKNLTEVNEVRVNVELKGPYVQYIKFKEDLAVAEMLLKINEETVKVKKDEVGKIYSILNLTTYAIDKKPFKEALGTAETDNSEGE